MTGQQLKNSILQMAIQGKLVPQDPNDEPASVLLEKIRKEKEQLIKEGKIKKEKNPSRIFRGDDGLFYERTGQGDPVCIDDEAPFDIPSSWEWVRLGTVVNIEMGQSPAGNTVSANKNGIEFHQGKVHFGETFLQESGQYTSDPKKYAEQNSVLLCVRAPVGKVNITRRKICIGRGLCAILPFTDMPLMFLYCLLEAYENIFVKQATGTTFIAITAETVKNQLVPLPPLKEQKRIADKISELYVPLKKYGDTESEAIMLNSQFPEQLKKSILQWAIQGKLVPQDPSDEPAEALLERIRAEKQRLIKEGKIKKDKHESIIYRRDNSYYEKLDGVERCIDDEIPFEIPESWGWVRLSNIFSILNGDRGKNYPAKYTLTSTGIPFISASNLDGRTVVSDNRLLCMTEEQYDKLANGKLIKGDVVVCIRGSLGKHGRYPFDKGAIASSLVILRCHLSEDVLAEYIMLWLDSPIFFSEIKKYDNGTAQPNLAAKSLEQFFVPLPPLLEQQRILEKIKEVLSYVNSSTSAQ